MYQLNIYCKDNTNNTKIFATLSNPNEFILVNNAQANCTLLNSIVKDKFYFINTQLMTETFPPVTTMGHGIISHFIKKWKNYPDVVNTLFDEFFNKCYTIDIPELTRYKEESLYKLFENDYLHLITNSTLNNDYYSTTQGSIYLTSIILSSLQFCIMIEKSFGELSTCPPQLMLQYNKYLGLPSNNTTIGTK